MNHEALRKQLVRHEGLRLKPYQCTAGKTTIGVGRNIQDIGITEAEAMLLLDNDIKRCESELDAALPWWREMADGRQRALLDMCFNLGLSRLLQFTKTIEHLKAGRYPEAAAEALNSRWARQVGRRAMTIAKLIKEG